MNYTLLVATALLAVALSVVLLAVGQTDFFTAFALHLASIYLGAAGVLAFQRRSTR